MAAREAIRGAVAQILNSRQLLLNVGSKAGVAVGMKFKILNPKGEDVVDPITQEILGSLEIVKVEVRVVNVSEKICLAETFKERMQAGIDPAFNSYLRALLPPGWANQGTIETLEAGGGYPALDEEDSFVKIGDPAVEKLRPSL